MTLLQVEDLAVHFPLGHGQTVRAVDPTGLVVSATTTLGSSSVAGDVASPVEPDAVVVPVAPVVAAGWTWWPCIMPVCSTAVHRSL